MSEAINFYDCSIQLKSVILLTYDLRYRYPATVQMNGTWYDNFYNCKILNSESKFSYYSEVIFNNVACFSFSFSAAKPRENCCQTFTRTWQRFQRPRHGILFVSLSRFEKWALLYKSPPSPSFRHNMAYSYVIQVADSESTWFLQYVSSFGDIRICSNKNYIHSIRGENVPIST